MIMETTLETTTTETSARPLSDSEMAALLECESIIRRGHAIALRVFVRMGTALRRIRDEELYRAKHSTFEVYCDKEWGMSAHHARNNIRAMEVYLALEDKKFHLLPTTESQARPMTALPPAEWAPAWEEVTGTAPDGKVTAKHVKSVVDRRLERLGIKQKPEGKKVESAESTEQPTAHEPAASETPKLQLVHIPRVTLTPAAPEQIIDVEVLSTREKQIRSIAREAQAKLIELAGAIGTPYDPTSANVSVWIQDLDELQAQVRRKEDWLTHHRKERGRRAGVS
jgi:hypothetical protein